MSNRDQNPENFAGFIPGSVQTSAGVTTRQTLMDLPDGREAMVTTRVGEDHPGLSPQEEFYLNVNPASLTEGLERDLARLVPQFDEITHYDRDGTPVYRVTGHARNVMEMRIANMRRALATARQNRAYAEQVQAAAKAAQVQQQSRIEALAQLKAQELIEQAEINRRAEQIAARSGVRSK